MNVQSYRDLKVWQLAMHLAERIYIELSNRLGFISETNMIDALNISSEVSRMLAGLRKSLSTKLASTP
jgi:hypothetical protein